MFELPFGTPPPLPILLLVALALVFTIILIFRAQSSSPPPRPLPRPSGALVAARCTFVVNIIGTMATSYYGRNARVSICDDDGANCMPFTGLAQLSTFTRWCWMLQGVYYVAASCGLRASELFGVAFSSALLVTAVTYTVLGTRRALNLRPARAT